MGALKLMVGTSQIVFGTDHPFGSSSNIASAMRNVGFNADELRGVDRENGFRILPKYKS